MTVQVLTGDCRQLLKTLPSKSVHCVVTSPPYFGLRDYSGGAAEIGREPTPKEFVAAMVDVFRDVRRVLRDDGTCWLNLGDTYASAWPCNRRNVVGTGALANGKREARPPRMGDGLKEKDLIGIPWRVAFALQEDGWYLRQDIIWSKLNPMPESVGDRCTKAHEYIFLLTKAPEYFYDAAAVYEPVTSDRAPSRKAKPTGAGHKALRPNGSAYDGTGDTRNRRSVWTIASVPFADAHFATFPPPLIEPCIQAGTSEHGCCTFCGAGWERIVSKSRSYQSGSGKSGVPVKGKKSDSHRRHGEKTDIRNGPVVTVRTLGFYPTCKCNGKDTPPLAVYPKKPLKPTEAGLDAWDRAKAEVDEKREQSCSDAARIFVRPAIVLDPFGGAGTTGLVSDRLHRSAILIELNPDYAEMARRRITGDSPLFSTVQMEAAQ